jgi:hypothetical protein
MTIQSLQKICTSLGYNLVDISDVGDKMFTLDGFTITETDKPVLVRGLAGEHPHPTKKQWVLEVEVRIPQTRWEPEDVDFATIGEFDSLRSAVYAALVEQERHKIDYVFESEYEARMDIDVGEEMF